MALSANIERVTEGERKLKKLPVAASTTIYAGGLLAYNATGYLVPAADTASFKYAGLAMEDVDNSSGSDGDLECMIEYDQSIFIPASSATQAWVGALAYATADDTVAITATNITVMGKVTKYDADGSLFGKGEGVLVDSSQKA